MRKNSTQVLYVRTALSWPSQLYWTDYARTAFYYTVITARMLDIRRSQYPQIRPVASLLACLVLYFNHTARTLPARSIILKYSRPTSQACSPVSPLFLAEPGSLRPTLSLHRRYSPRASVPRARGEGSCVMTWQDQSGPAPSLPPLFPSGPAAS